MVKKVEEMQVTKCAGVQVILNGEGQIVGKIIIAFPRSGSGTVHLNVWDWSDPENVPPVQYGKASGFGYDRVSAAIEGLEFAGISFTDYPKNYVAALAEKGFQVMSLL